ncbi:MAG: D-2-hydroxyacid dehydrogenase [Marivibrio sp.]|uniref:D-2-hydroxyacid dehydrogenase n=1 Tax=Marivibrio sp. TaxID=2039719 RepID=UPI0032F02982
MSGGDDRLLILYAAPDEIRDIVEARAGELPVRYVARSADLDAALKDFRPTIVFGTGGGGVAKEDLKRALDFESVRWLSNGGAGIEHLLPWDPAAKTVTNAAGVNADFLAEYAAGALMAMNLRLMEHRTNQRARRWAERTWTPIAGKRLCVVGLGRVGRAVAARAAGLGLKVVGVRANPQPTEHVSEVFGPDEIERAVADCDFVAVHAALTPQSRGLVDAAVFRAMEPGVGFLNAARGPVVDEAALIRALENGTIGQAVLDVFETEPLPEASPLWSFDQVLITPHIADLVDDWFRRMTSAFFDNLDRRRAGLSLDNRVDPAVGY